MARRRRKQAVKTYNAASRDTAMARLAAARVSGQAALDAIDAALAHFVDEDDEDGEDRDEEIDAAIEHVGAMTRALECAEVAMLTTDPTVGEPWAEDDDEDETGGDSFDEDKP